MECSPSFLLMWTWQGQGWGWASTCSLGHFYQGPLTLNQLEPGCPDPSPLGIACLSAHLFSKPSSPGVDGCKKRCECECTWVGDRVHIHRDLYCARSCSRHLARNIVFNPQNNPER